MKKHIFTPYIISNIAFNMLETENNIYIEYIHFYNDDLSNFGFLYEKLMSYNKNVTFLNVKDVRLFHYLKRYKGFLYLRKTLVLGSFEYSNNLMKSSKDILREKKLIKKFTK